MEKDTNQKWKKMERSSKKYLNTKNIEWEALGGGDRVYIEPNLLHSAVCLEEGILIDTFSPVREDFLSGGTVSYFGDKK